MKFMGQEVLQYEDYETEIVYYLADGSMVIQPKNVPLPTSAIERTDATDALLFGSPEMYYPEGPRIPPTYAHTTKPRTLNRAGRRAQKRAGR